MRNFIVSVSKFLTRALTMVNFIRILSYGLTMGKLVRNSNRFRRNKFVIFSLFCFFIGFSISENEQLAKAQLVPIPLLVQQPGTTHPNFEASQLNNSTSSAMIQVLSTSLIEGRDVFRVKITDKSDITNAEIVYIRNGQLVAQELTREPNNIYKALIDPHLPSTVVVTNVVELDGKTASVVKVLNVTPLPNNMFGQITNFLYGVGKSIVSIFRSTNQ
jgi:hypothetical protein